MRDSVHYLSLTSVITITGILGWGCAQIESEESVDTVEEAVLGGRLAGISAADFTAAKDNFNQVEGIADGLGPVFNERACGLCHTQGASGGAGVQIERRYGRFVNGVFDPMSSSGGSLRQLFALDPFNSGSGGQCTVPIEAEPSGATVHNVGRLTTPLFGLGLVDAMPDSFFEALAAAEPVAIRGIANHVTTLLPNPADASQSVGGLRVGRFGWKAGVPNLAQFAADAYLNEMGITTQHCIQGTSVVAFATESAPNGVPQPPGCDDLAAPAPAGSPAGTDESVGSCAGNLTELQDDVQSFTTFMTFLSPPSRDLSNGGALAQGQSLFKQIGCDGCHTSKAFHTPNPAPNGVPGNYAFSPYSDFLIHDMGSLGDRIGNAGDTLEMTQRMRTAPLWGIRFRDRLLHDGRATSVAAAIAAHDGQGKVAAKAFKDLNPGKQKSVVKFVLSL